MKKKKREERHKLPITGLPKQRNIQKPLKRKKNISIFSKNKSFKKKKIPKRHRNVGTKILGMIFLIITFGLIFISVKYILTTRGKENTKNIKETYVLGIDKVPAYPESTFLFERDKDTDTVQNFLMSGQSAYKLPDNITKEDVNKYYQEKLPKLGWTNVLSVPLGSEDKKFGEYWVKDGKGLRIYIKGSAVWYEIISQEDATTGLAAEVADEIERELLLAGSETQDLLPDFPWILQVPKEYLISYSSTDIKDLRSVTFKKMGTNLIYSLTPIGYYKDGTYDDLLYKYIESKNTTKTKEWGIQNSYYIIKNGKNILMADIISPQGLIKGAVMYNSFDNAIYALLSSIEKDDVFFEYILENIHPQESNS